MAVDSEGEILARSNHVFEGYWDQPDETVKALAGGWFHTGDGGQLEGPYVVISDRKKDVIITGGENVSSIEVEDCLYQHPAVAEAAVIGIPDEKWGETIKALVMLRAGVQATEAQIQHFDKHRKGHGKVEVAFGNMLIEAFGDQRYANEQEEAQRQYLDRRMVVHKGANGAGEDQHKRHGNHHGSHHNPQTVGHANRRNDRIEGKHNVQ